MREDLHSRIIGFLKLALPLAALALLSTIFLFSRSLDRSGGLTLPTSALVERAASEQVTGPQFSGTTQEGARVSFTAARAWPDPEDPRRTSAENVWAGFRLADGSVVTFRAGKAVIDQGEDVATLEGGVRIVSSTGYSATTDAVTARISRIDARSLGRVEANGPAGRITAGRFALVAGEEADTVQLVFNEGVRLVYRPGAVSAE